MAFNAKNLTYEPNEPSFLRKLKAQFGDVDSARHDRQATRPQRVNEDEDDADGPTYVAENGLDIITKSQYSEMQKSDEQNRPKELDPLTGEESKIEKMEAGDASNQERPKAAAVASIGASGRKRRAKAIGGDDVDEIASKIERKPAKKRVQKARKTKLSFEQDG